MELGTPIYLHRGCLAIYDRKTMNKRRLPTMTPWSATLRVGTTEKPSPNDVAFLGWEGTFRGYSATRAVH
jgi:hypothetical protein